MVHACDGSPKRRLHGSTHRGSSLHLGKIQKGFTEKGRDNSMKTGKISKSQEHVELGVEKKNLGREKSTGKGSKIKSVVISTAPGSWIQ